MITYKVITSLPLSLFSFFLFGILLWSLMTDIKPYEITVRHDDGVNTLQHYRNEWVTYYSKGTTHHRIQPINKNGSHPELWLSTYQSVSYDVFVNDRYNCLHLKKDEKSLLTKENQQRGYVIATERILRTKGKGSEPCLSGTYAGNRSYHLMEFNPYYDMIFLLNGRFGAILKDSVRYLQYYPIGVGET